MQQEPAVFPLADADKCVKCALCLPHCPTYRIALDEGESPRGRIALMQGFASGALAMTPALRSHLDHCLACRACETVCPAQVPYGKLIDAAHALLLQHGQRPSISVRLFGACMRNPFLLRSLHVCLWLVQQLGLLRLASLSARLRRLTNMLPWVAAPHRWQSVYTSSQDTGKEVQLFLGCVARISQPGVNGASIRMLNELGYSVRIPETQGCCGALDQHAGRVPQAAAAAFRNLTAFGADPAVPLLHTASGCGASLGEYPQLVADPRAALFSKRCHDISEFLATQENLGQLRFRPLATTVVLHTPCTLKNVLKSGKAVEQLLRHIPEMDLRVLPDSSGCCGAAGSYVLSEPVISDRLVDDLIAAVRQSAAEYLLTSNVGCSLHLAAALRRHGLRVRVLHPVELMAMQLPDTRQSAV